MILSQKQNFSKLNLETQKAIVWQQSVDKAEKCLPDEETKSITLRPERSVSVTRLWLIILFKLINLLHISLLFYDLRVALDRTTEALDEVMLCANS